MKRLMAITVLSFLFIKPVFGNGYVVEYMDKRVDTQVKVIDNRTLISLRDLGETLHLAVVYDGQENTVLLKSNTGNSSLLIDLNTGLADAAINGNEASHYNHSKNIKLEVPPKKINGKIYVPIRFVCDMFSAPIEVKGNVVKIQYIHYPTQEEKPVVVEEKIIKDEQVISEEGALPTIWNNHDIENADFHYRNAQKLVKLEMKNSMSAKFDIEGIPMIFYTGDNKNDIAVSGRVWGTNSYGGYVNSSYDVIFYDGEWTSFAVYIDGVLVITNKW